MSTANLIHLRMGKVSRHLWSQLCLGQPMQLGIAAVHSIVDAMFNRRFSTAKRDCDQFETIVVRGKNNSVT